MDALMPSVRNFWAKKSTIGCWSPLLRSPNSFFKNRVPEWRTIRESP
jgi:hypothetical protein